MIEAVPYTCEGCGARNRDRQAVCWKCSAPPPAVPDLFDDLFEGVNSAYAAYVEANGTDEGFESWLDNPTEVA